MPTVVKANRKVVNSICAGFLIVLAALFGLGHNLDQVSKLWLLDFALVAIFIIALCLLGKRKDNHFAPL